MKKFNSIIVSVLFYYLLLLGIIMTIDGFDGADKGNPFWIQFLLIGTVALAGAGVIGAIQTSNSLRLSEADDSPLISDETKEKAMTQLVEARVLRMVFVALGLFAGLIYIFTKLV